ncbi:hypothetical protein [Pseudidiomarina sp.]|uniref:hypothetical protein n=1 Tax=Pseudidiomarina sp. TaxID=2081707 RepID=UPI00299DB6C1|nr:hypothetical protein [Pseudidiomarina sp.]MDX1705676.1 hypothetical protein [Pseudidiomarina sp.]
MLKFDTEKKKRNYLGIAWLVAMFDALAYLPVGLAAIMLWLLGPAAEYGSEGGWIYLLVSGFCLIIWVSAVTYLVMNKRFSADNFPTALRYSLLPMIGMGVAAAGLLLVFIGFMAGSLGKAY